MFRASLKIAFFIFWALLLGLLQALVLIFHKGKWSRLIPQLFHRGICLVFGIRYTIKGTPFKGQTLYTSNHLSYLDIPLLGSILRASFLAKSDVSSWPVFGTLANLRQTVYIVRRRTAIGKAKDQISNHLDQGRSMIVFPEGTSTSGMHVKDLKSGLFSITDGRDIVIQPVTIALKWVDGKKPATQDEFNIYAWPLEMETSLPEHLWLFAKTRGAKLVVVFHDVLRSQNFPDRKALSQACHERISGGLKTELLN